MSGYDIEMAIKFSNLIDCPLIINGGAGNYNHIYLALKNDDIGAAGCSSIFHFGDNNPIRARSTLRNMKILMRNLK